MSAFLVSDNHINTLINYGYNHKLYIWHNDKAIYFNKSPDKIGQILINENYRSLNSRYDNEDKPHDFNFELKPCMFKPVEIIAACKCYEYQACETIDYYSTHAHWIIKSIINNAIHDLPGYEDAISVIR